jgi:hypothetical protein
MTTKTCSKCGDAKVFTDYHKNRLGKHGLSAQCKECISNKMKAYYKNNTEKRIDYRRHYCKNNKESVLAYKRRYQKQKRIEDPVYKVSMNLRSRMGNIIRGERKTKTTESLIGCSFSFVKKHLESQFTEGMSWDNYGIHGWHVDHIIPCASFDLSNPEEQHKCFHYTNLQPLWAQDNLRKADNLPHEI